MLTPKTIDLTIYQGASFYKSWEIQDKDGNPIDLTGWSAYCQIRKRKISEETLLDLSTADGTLFIEVSADKTEYGFNLTQADTQVLNLKEAVYDINLVDPEGYVVRIQEGKITISLAVTRTWESSS